MPYLKYICLLLILCASAGCSRSALHDAQVVVTQADSLWHAGKMYGIDEGDSATLAQTYETLGKYAKFSIVNSQLSIAYSHACYHYGRLLRKSNDPVSAMQVFISATHSRTRDYHILGRIYSNMGDLCHLAGDFPLSYDMYEKSGEMYLHNGDTLLYYYDINNMALELAEQGKKDSTLRLIHEIEKQCTDRNVLNKTIETKAEVYFKCQSFDSALYYANLFCTQEKYNSTGLLIKAQTFSLLHEQDSATYYSNLVIEKSTSPYAIHNALYILTNDDSTKDIEDVRKTAADRSDVQKLLKIQQGALSQAVQLLEQDLARKPSWIWLYTMIASFFVMGSIIGIYTYNRRKKHLLLSQKIKDLKDTETQTMSQMREKIEEQCALLKSSPHITKDLSWKDFEQTCRIINQQFYLLASKLQNTKGLNETETRLCILVLIGFNEKEISQTLPYALNSIGKLKYRTCQKLGISAKNLRENIISIAIGDTIK